MVKMYDNKLSDFIFYSCSAICCSCFYRSLWAGQYCLELENRFILFFLVTENHFILLVNNMYFLESKGNFFPDQMMLSSLLAYSLGSCHAVGSLTYLAKPPRGMNLHLVKVEGQISHLLFFFFMLLILSKASFSFKFFNMRFMYFLFPIFGFPLILLACAWQLSNEFLMCFAFSVCLIVLNQENSTIPKAPYVNIWACQQ